MGANSKRQISQVLDCSLKSVGTLPFDFDTGSCAYKEKLIVLCADKQKKLQPQSCYISSEATNFTATSMTTSRNFRHYATQLAGAHGMILAVGDTLHVKAEYFDMKEWKVTKKYPFSDVVYWAPLVVYAEQIYVFGGQGQNQRATADLNTIARFSPLSHSWSKVGELLSPRYGHGAIIDMGNAVIVGGNGRRTSEKCKIDNSGIIKGACQALQLELDDYQFFPELNLVSEDYCQETTSS